MSTYQISTQDTGYNAYEYDFSQDPIESTNTTVTVTCTDQEPSTSIPLTFHNPTLLGGSGLCDTHKIDSLKLITREQKPDLLARTSREDLSIDQRMTTAELIEDSFDKAIAYLRIADTTGISLDKKRSCLDNAMAAASNMTYIPAQMHIYTEIAKTEGIETEQRNNCVALALETAKKLEEKDTQAIDYCALANTPGISPSQKQECELGAKTAVTEIKNKAQQAKIYVAIAETFALDASQRDETMNLAMQATAEIPDGYDRAMTYIFLTRFYGNYETEWITCVDNAMKDAATITNKEKQVLAYCTIGSLQEIDTHTKTSCLRNAKCTAISIESQSFQARVYAIIGMLEESPEALNQDFTLARNFADTIDNEEQKSAIHSFIDDTEHRAKSADQEDVTYAINNLNYEMRLEREQAFMSRVISGTPTIEDTEDLFP